MSPDLLLLPAVLVAFTVEATLGFGATVVAVGLGSLVVPIRELLPAFVIVNLTLSCYVAIRYRAHVDWKFLLGRIVPFMAIGFPLGFLIFSALPESTMKRAFGVFLVGLSIVELRKMARGVVVQEALPVPVELGALVGAGVIHGAFSTGGPLAVWASGRQLPEKGRFRSTLGALWLIMNVVFIASRYAKGDVNARTVELLPLLVPGLVGGLVLGEIAHSRLPERAFRIAVFCVLLVIGCVLVVRG